MRLHGTKLLILMACAWWAGCSHGASKQPSTAVASKPRAVSADELCGERGGPNNVYVVTSESNLNRPAIDKLSQVVATSDRPIEVCGAEAQYEYVAGLRCDDGSRPFTSTDQARQARDGSVSGAGRCGTHVDRYTVVCPEKTYTIHLDLYMCTRAEVPASSTPTLVTDQGISAPVPPGWTYAFDRSSPVVAAFRGPKDTQLFIQRGRDDSIAGLTPLFAASGLPAPNQIVERGDVGRGDVLLVFDRDDVAVLQTGQGDESWTALVQASPSSLGDRAITAYAILSQVRTNDHVYMAWDDMLTDQGEFRVRGDTVGGRDVAVPDGWKSAASKDGLVSRLDVAGQGSVVIIQQQFGASVARNARHLAEVIVGTVLTSGKAATIVHHRWDQQKRSYRLVADYGEGSRLALILQVTPAGDYHSFFLAGPSRTVATHDGLAVLEAISGYHPEWCPSGRCGP